MSACNRKAWDHFSKPQRKNIEMWHKQATEIKSALLEEALAERNEEEMDLSESDSENEIDKHNELELDRSRIPAKKPRWEDSKAVNHLQVRKFLTQKNIHIIFCIRISSTFIIITSYFS